MQSVQNAAGRLVTGLGRWEHNTCPVAAPLAAGSSAGDVQVGDVGIHTDVANRCSLAGTAPAYLSDECRLTSSVGLRFLGYSDSRTCVHRRANNGYVVAVLRLPVLGCGTVCRCSFENRTFSFNRFKTALKTFFVLG